MEMRASVVCCWGFLPAPAFQRLFACAVLGSVGLLLCSLSWNHLPNPMDIMFKSVLTTPPAPRLRSDAGCSARPFQASFQGSFVSVKAAGGWERRANHSSSLTLPPTCPPTWSACRTVTYLARGHLLPTVYVITPTYTRPTQTADLLRLCYTLSHVPRVHWIIVEDSTETTASVTALLAQCKGPSITHLAAKHKEKKHRGVTQRNAALRWMRACVLPGSSAGGIYFADDDNTYDVRVFEAVRWTQLVSVWLVGNVGGVLWEGPICSFGKVTGWAGNYGQNRQFPVDMAAFSIGVNFLLQKPLLLFSNLWPRGNLETRFLESLNITMVNLTPEPDDNCSQVIAVISIFV